ncbi:hypothetical protein IB237_23410 [Agrobacterium sp. AGB01]|uniref:hypothetical protein n=1 Tax=Agrobacterium sp. AGB01 TaxID=2769302 RepID=UPI0017837CA9|nr:hypothetical protein [Agrobacterium sp. AGB01]MBD9390153.1 hypothetical protein [Agrobacterium sp. AGB01]
MSSDAWFHRVKSAQRDLIKLVGGIERAAQISSMSKSQIGRFNNTADTELMSVSVVYALEADCGVPVVTNAMAELSGRRLSDPDADREADICVQRAKADLVKKLGELLSRSADAAADGFISVAEARQLMGLSSDIDQINSRFRQSLAIVASRGGEHVGLKLVKGE